MGYYNWYWHGSGTSWGEYHQKKELVGDVTNAIGSQTKAIVGSIDDMRQDMREGFNQIDRTMQAGFSAIFQQLGALQDTMDELVQLAKTPIQTQAYEQFEIARDMARQQLFIESLEAIDKAIDLHKMEWRFHLHRGTLLLGSAENTESINVEQAEESFLLAARYSKVDNPAIAAGAFSGAAMAAYVQGIEQPQKLEDALKYANQATGLDESNALAWGQKSKYHAALSQGEQVCLPLEKAIRIDGDWSIAPTQDGDFEPHAEPVVKLLTDMHTEYEQTAADKAAALLAEYGEWPVPEDEPHIVRWKSLADKSSGETLSGLVRLVNEGLDALEASFNGQWLTGAQISLGLDMMMYSARITVHGPIFDGDYELLPPATELNEDYIGTRTDKGSSEALKFIIGAEYFLEIETVRPQSQQLIQTNYTRTVKFTKPFRRAKDGTYAQLNLQPPGPTIEDETIISSGQSWGGVIISQLNPPLPAYAGGKEAPSESGKEAPSKGGKVASSSASGTRESSNDPLAIAAMVLAVSSIFCGGPFLSVPAYLVAMKAEGSLAKTARVLAGVITVVMGAIYALYFLFVFLMLGF